MTQAAAHAMRADSRVLVSDIGGTNARFALADLDTPAHLVDGSVREYAIADFATPVDVVRHYLAQVGACVDAAVFAVAGRVTHGEVQLTNRGWVISTEQVRQALDLSHLTLINDFTAQAMAITRLQPQDVVAIGEGHLPAFDQRQTRTYAVIGPGTGLGVGGLMVRDGRCYPLETEGGHAGFAPGTTDEMRVLQSLLNRFGRVSCERLVSGPGLSNLHAALCDMHGEPLQTMLPSQITERAQAGDARCREAVSLFCTAFGSMAGDVVLMQGAWDGVFLAGGLVPKMIGSLQSSTFRTAFENKGRFAGALARVPTFAVMHPHAGLLGASAQAAAVWRAEWRDAR